MKCCTFFGHRENIDLDYERLKDAIEGLIEQGVEVFYVGNQGAFDAMVYRCLKQLREVYPNISIGVVFAYLPDGKRNVPDEMYPEIEGHPKFAVERRNRWMLEQADCCICYVNHPWGGAYKFAEQALRRGMPVINIGRWEQTIRSRNKTDTH